MLAITITKTLLILTNIKFKSVGFTMVGNADVKLILSDY